MLQGSERSGFPRKNTVWLFSIPFILLVGTIVTGEPQKPSASAISVDAIQDSLVRRFNRIQDYSARVKISVDMPGLRVPAKEVRLYFKHPDQVKVEAEGVAVVPRTGLTVDPMEMMDDLVGSRMAGMVKRGTRTAWIVEGEIHPDSVVYPGFDRSPVDHASLTVRLEIDSEGWFISRVETLLDTARVMVVEWDFREYEDDIWLPDGTEWTVTIPGDFLERLGNGEPMSGPFGETRDNGGDSNREGLEGWVRLEYSDYRVNQGIGDEVFQK